MDDGESASIDEIRLWNVSRLKCFLRERNLKVSGRKDELVALVFAALSLPDLAPAATGNSASEKEEQYADLLRIPTGTLPDPHQLQDWKSETSSITKWPPTMAFDIGTYLTNIDDVPLKKRLMSDYKDGKAYSYFASGWVKEVQYHGISDDSAYCFLRTECTPSQKVNNVPWKVWVCVDKRSGAVQSAYCTCFAGYIGTCNHVAAILFKVDFAWRNGLTNPACTSKECGWSAFGAQHKVEPRRISDVVLSKPLFSKHASTNTEGINSAVRKLFSPVNARASRSRPPASLETLVDALYPDFPDACFMKYARPATPDACEPSLDINVACQEVIQTSSLPVPLWNFAEQFKSVDDFLSGLPTYSSAQVEELERATRGQASNEEWLKQRRGRITGSIAHSVYTKGKRLMESKGKSIDCAALVKRILGYVTVNPNVPSLKYGRELEDEARNRYKVALKSAGHKHLRVEECGLRIKGDKVFIGASADAVVTCECCGSGLLEIKCPISVAHTKPDETLPYINMINGKPHLKENHPYFSQVQLQMGVWQRTWCDFFVYSRHGHVCIREPFDQDRWDELLTTCEHFFRAKLAKELVTRELYHAEEQVDMEID